MQQGYACKLTLHVCACIQFGPTLNCCMACMSMAFVRSTQPCLHLHVSTCMMQYARKQHLTPPPQLYKCLTGMQRDPGLWPRLEWDGGDKAAATARRNASIDRAHARLATAQKARLEAKAKEEKWVLDFVQFAVRNCECNRFEQGLLLEHTNTLSST